MRVKILGQYWNLVFEPLWRYRDEKGHKVDGLCDPPSAKNRTIHIEENLKGIDELETIIHECEHASNPNVKEEYVTQKSRDLTLILWNLGYRRARP